MDDLKIISVNVRGLNTYEKRIKVYDWLNDSQIDIAILQETHYVEKNVSKYDARWFGKSVHSFSDSTFSRGVSVLIRKDLDIEILNSHSSVDGRKLLLNVKFDNNICTIVNIYAPNTELSRIEFFRNMNCYITRYSAKELGCFHIIFAQILTAHNFCLTRITASISIYANALGYFLSIKVEFVMRNMISICLCCCI